MENRAIIEQVALAWVNTPYRWGGDDPAAGIDCSGLVIELLETAGILPRGYEATAQSIYEHFKDKVTEAPRFGTLLFFGVSTAQITHTAFALNLDFMLEAGGGGSSTTDLAAAIKQNAFVRVRPLRWRKDRVACVHPVYPWILET